ncbi:Hsp70 family protein [Dactylosporangium sp. AC04546]|uniref:Hsp70 family protein n=1 Tax=Dactylosporangium sp. AC04546 TaxID=2862460 RepID=UPI001EDD9EC7|nr:Hsp70 family protein [Dactylosporangium sp. AC04546]WVK83668.1 Hsp70 family protein [Dactylosporangium sp. AC04546]
MRLGIDFGTSHTVAVFTRPDGRTEALLFDSSPLLPSAVYVDGEGALLVGRDAERSARLDPAAYEPHPKRRIDESSLFLGGRDLPIAQIVGAVLHRAAEEGRRALGAAPSGAVLTHPAGWGPTRRALLADAAGRAGLPAVELVPEPVAAAMYFTAVLGHHVPDGHAVVVYDFGGGTFDISVVRRAAGGWDVVAAQGLDDVGGVDLDAAIVDWAGQRVAGQDPALWQRLAAPATTPDRRHRRALWDDARSVKELLSRASTAGLAVPLYDVDLHLTRPEFEALARPWLERTVALTTATLFTSGVTADRLAGVFLVGGASRVPLVATLLHRALGVAPVVLEQPELVVAQGSLLASGAPMAAPVPPQPAPIAPIPTSPPVGPSSPAAGPTVPVSPAPVARATASVPPAPVSPPVAAPPAPPASAAPAPAPADPFAAIPSPSASPASAAPAPAPAGSFGAIPSQPAPPASAADPFAAIPSPPAPPASVAPVSPFAPISSPPASAPPAPAPAGPFVPISGPPVSGPPTSFAAAPVSATPAAAMPVSPAPFASAAPPTAPPTAPPVAKPAQVPAPSPADGQTDHRRGGRVLLAALLAVLAAGSLSLLVGDFGSSSPLLSGVMTPLMAKPIAVLLAMALIVVTAGAQVVPAYRALGPALIAAGGAVVTTFLAALFWDAGQSFRLADGIAYRLTAESSYFSGTDFAFLITGALILAGAGVWRLVGRRRPPAPSRLLAPAGARAARLSWIALWAGLGFLLAEASVGGQTIYARRYFDDYRIDIRPMRGVLYMDGALTWYLAYAMGLTAMIGAVLVAAAAVHNVLAKRPAWTPRVRLAGGITIAVIAVYVFLTGLWEYWFSTDGSSGYLRELDLYYWRKVVTFDLSSVSTWTYTIVAVGVLVAVGVPSYLRARRSGARP